MTALDNRIGKMGRAKHHPTDVVRHCCGLLQQLLQGGDNPAGHVSRGGRFDPTDNLLTLHQHSVGVRASYINTYALLHWALLNKGGCRCMTSAMDIYRIDEQYGIWLLVISTDMEGLSYHRMLFSQVTMATDRLFTIS